MAKQPQMHDEPNSGIDKKKSSPENSIFFFAKPLSFDFNFESAASEYMPHCSFTSNFSHEYHLLFLNFRLIGRALGGRKKHPIAICLMLITELVCVVTLMRERTRDCVYSV